VPTTHTFTVDTWYNWAFVYDKNRIRMYQNGTFLEDIDLGGATPNLQPDVLLLSQTGNQRLDGILDEISIHDYARTAAEILSDYNAISRGPVGYWKFDEGVGGTASDSSGNGNTGTLANGPQWVNGASGTAVDLDGVDDFIDVPSSSSLVIHGHKVAVEAWMRPTITLDSSTPMMDLLTKGNEYAFTINHDVNDGKVWFWIGIVTPGYFQGEGVSTTTDRWTAGTWYHLAGTYDGTMLKIYVNGALENSRAVSGELWTQEPNYVEYPLSIGAYTWMDASLPYGTIYGRLFFFHGAIDEVKIYNYARTEEQIQNDFQSVFVKYANNPVFDIGAADFWDDLSVWAPSVLYKDGQYEMWYCGGRNDQYIKIGLATSSDGISWSRYGNAPVLDVSSSQWDSLQVSSPSVVFDGSQYMMWYSGGTGSANMPIGLATSADGIVWTKYSGNPVFSGGRYCSVLYDGSIFKMWYEGYDYTIRHATSPNGISWTDYGNNPVLVHGSSGSWDSMYVGAPSVVFDGSKYLMSYTGYRNSIFSREIGLAQSSDGITWSKAPNNPIIGIGSAGAWDDTFVDQSSMVLVGSTLKMWYTGFDGTNTVSSPTYYHRIGLATRAPAPPTADFAFYPPQPHVSETVLFDASASTPNGGTIISYGWNFGDGNITITSSSQVTHTYENENAYEVTLNVTDSEDLWSTMAKSVLVRERTPPKIEILSPLNMTYYTESISLTFEVDETTSWVGYSLDNQSNVTIFGNTTIDVQYGSHQVTIYANDTADKMGSSGTIHFTVEKHDVAAVGIAISKNVVGQGCSVSINATFENQGDYTETFNATIFANMTPIETHTVLLSGGDSVNVTFSWNTSAFVKGDYIISAYATEALGETDTTDNTLIDGAVYVGIPGDVDGNRIVNMLDLYKVALVFGATRDNPIYVANCDIEDNGMINMLDLWITAMHFGQTDP
jgi:predicted GH43/DUF377 family glycosyl hydrolase